MRLNLSTQSGFRSDIITRARNVQGRCVGARPKTTETLPNGLIKFGYEVTFNREDVRRYIFKWELP